MEDDLVVAPEHERQQGTGRFAWGMALGTALGSLAVILLLSIVALVIYFDMRAQLEPYSGAKSSEVTYVQASEPWIDMRDGKRGQVVGMADGGWGSGSDMPHGAIADFSLSKMIRQNDVPARVVVRILVTPKTTLTLAGKPWKPEGTNRDESPAEMLFSNDGSDDSSYEFLQDRELTVRFRREGDALVAESIDASRVVILAEDLLDY